ncbi:MAG: hypothetical protein WAQ05_03370, partial [Rubrivivax sp.]
GLGLAFGTSVAGVATSAMLGLMSALARRERQQVAQQLDSCIAGPLRSLSRSHQREASLRLMQAQADLMPALATQLQTLMLQMAQQGQQLHASLLASQAQFQADAQRNYTGLAAAVDQSLKTSLADSARLAGAAIEPAVQATLAGLAREATGVQQALGAAVQQQIDGVSQRLDNGAAALAQRLQASLDQVALTFEQRSATLLRNIAENQAAADQAAAAREQQRIAALQGSLATVNTALAQTVQAFGTQTETQVQAAAELIAELRRTLSDSLQRDNLVLDERNRLLATLGQLLDAVNHASTEQRAAIDALVAASTTMLDQVGTRFAGTVDQQSQALQAVADQVSSSAVEVASLGEGFGVAVQQFGSASEQLAAQLQRIEGALSQSLARSDEQLAYYVAQAREIIDLTLGSQKQIVDDLQQLKRSTAEAA